jgi:hypothetical protein
MIIDTQSMDGRRVPHFVYKNDDGKDIIVSLIGLSKPAAKVDIDDLPMTWDHAEFSIRFQCNVRTYHFKVLLRLSKTKDLFFEISKSSHKSMKSGATKKHL